MAANSVEWTNRHDMLDLTVRIHAEVVGAAQALGQRRAPPFSSTEKTRRCWIPAAWDRRLRPFVFCCFTSAISCGCIRICACGQLKVSEICKQKES